MIAMLRFAAADCAEWLARCGTAIDRALIALVFACIIALAIIQMARLF